MSTDQQQFSGSLSPGFTIQAASHTPGPESVEIAPRPPESERRAASRYPAMCATLVSAHSGAVPLPGHLIDISVNGCRVKLERGQLSGIMTRVEVQFELRGIAFRLIGVTVGSRNRQGLAIRFLEMSERRRESLVEVLAELAREVEAKAGQTARLPVPPSAGLPVNAPPMNLSAKAMPATLGDLNPASPAPQPAVNAVPATKKVQRSVEVKLGKHGERRVYLRHDVNTRARLLLIRSNLSMHGTIQNLSQGGCRIHTDERFNVGMFVRLEIEFYLRGLPFRLGGVTQAVLDKFSVRIRFLDMSARSREQLDLLIAEIGEAEAELDSTAS